MKDKNYCIKCERSDFNCIWQYKSINAPVPTNGLRYNALQLSVTRCVDEKLNICVHTLDNSPGTSIGSWHSPVSNSWTATTPKHQVQSSQSTVGSLNRQVALKLVKAQYSIIESGPAVILHLEYSTAPGIRTRSSLLLAFIVLFCYPYSILLFGIVINQNYMKSDKKTFGQFQSAPISLHPK